MKPIREYITESYNGHMPQYFDTDREFILINTTEYDGGQKEAYVQAFTLKDDVTDELGLTENDVKQFKNIKVGECIKIEGDYDGVYVMRVCK